MKTEFFSIILSFVFIIALLSAPSDATGLLQDNVTFIVG